MSAWRAVRYVKSMRSRSTITSVHPELRSIARFLPRRFSVGPRTLGPVRVAFALFERRRTFADVEVHDLGPGVAVRLHRGGARDGRVPALLWIHGGGYVMGSARQADELCRRFARTLGVLVAAVDYRLAPEHPHPAALDDCTTALKWLLTLPEVDPARVAIGGASAGGGLAAALAHRTRDDEAVALVFQLLVYPMLDDRTVAGPGGPHLGWNGSSNQFGWQSYLGTTESGVGSPARHTNFGALAPAWLGVGTLDLFHDEVQEYAQRLRSAGVPCTVEIVDGAFHGFDVAAPRSSVARHFFDSQCASLREAFDAPI